MNDERFSRLKNLVVGFHGALVQHDFSDTDLSLRNFPVECCHHACKLLTVFLFEQGFTDIEKQVGTRPNSATGQHLWLIVESVIVDITASQFDNELDKVIVTGDSTWHSSLKGKPSHFGLEGEPLSDYVPRAKSHYEGLCEELAAMAIRIAAQ